MKNSTPLLLLIISLLVFCLPCFSAAAGPRVQAPQVLAGNQDSSDTVQKERHEDSLITLAATGQNDTVAMDTLNPDSLTVAGAKKHADSIKTASTMQMQKKTAPVQTPWHSPYIGIGAGFSLGSDDLFSAWETALPDSASNFTALQISKKFKMAVKEPPTPYNLIFPVLISLGLVSDSLHSIVLDFPVSFHTKQFNATFSADSTPYQIQLYHSLNMLSVKP